MDQFRCENEALTGTGEHAWASGRGEQERDREVLIKEKTAEEDKEEVETPSSAEIT